MNDATSNPIDPGALSIEHNADQQRFVSVLDEEGREAVVTYRLMDGKMGITHTGVPPRYRRQGIAGRMVERALQHARSNDLTVVPYCSYVAHYINEHPEHKSLLKK
ncbi:MAG: GNAT family N-acetyltransferase [Longimonas sp.]|uniref:GNAT family N-acetyltransferase n=1 Tax=Longimonas sp. TaxID=2039626 RepID=UPI003352664C